MSNRSYLVALNNADASTCYDENQDALVCGTNCVPVLWLSLFSDCDWTTCRQPMTDGAGNPIDSVVPSLIAKRSESLRVADAKRPSIKRFMPAESIEYFDQLIAAVNSVSSAYIMVDLSEILVLDTKIHLSLKHWMAAFNSQSQAKWKRLSTAANIEYDVASKDFLFSAPESRSLLRGDRYCRAVPWNDPLPQKDTRSSEQRVIDAMANLRVMFSAVWNKNEQWTALYQSGDQKVMDRLIQRACLPHGLDCSTFKAILAVNQNLNKSFYDMINNVVLREGNPDKRSADF